MYVFALFLLGFFVFGGVVVVYVYVCVFVVVVVIFVIFLKAK